MSDRDPLAKAYRVLAALRANETSELFAQPESFGYHFEQWVSPYTKGAHRYGGIAIVLQDRASAEWLSKQFRPDVQEWGREPTLLTNQRLQKLLERVFRVSIAETYVTNAFPFVKPGGMSANLSKATVAKTVAKYTVPELKLASPCVTLALGKLVSSALTRAGVSHVALRHAAARSGGLEAHVREWRERGACS